MLFLIYVYLLFFLLLPVIYVLYIKDLIAKKGSVHLFGIEGYFGLPGTGKTMAMCRALEKLRKRYGDKIYICTNFNWLGQDFSFETWKQLTKQYDKPLVVAWDEIQNEFNSRDFKNFPIALLTQLTQVRKGHGLKILYTSQRFGFVDKNFRALSSQVSDCVTKMGRFTVVKTYDIRDYEELSNTVEFSKQRKIFPKVAYGFIQTEKLRNSYDSYKMLETAKFKAQTGGYMGRDEIAVINQNS